jgi:ribonuclease HII
MRSVESQRIIGVDENGLGPKLGPLVVTGVRLRLEGPPPSLAELRAATGIDDSKRVFTPARRGRGEALALGLLGIPGAASPAELLAGRLVPPPWDHPEACPTSTLPCPALPVRPLPRWTRNARDVATGLRRLGVVVERVACVVLCPGTLNVALGDGTSKLAVDLRLFEVVVEALRAEARECEAICGKVGGTNRYAERFVAWAGRPVRVEVESRARSTYEVEGAGRVSFVRDADASEPAVAMASIVGKYVRELWMDDLAAAAEWEGPTPSGYHDAASDRLEARLRERIAAGVLTYPAGCVRRIR